MARQLAPGVVIGGFRLEQKFHHGGIGTLWKVSRADIAVPLVMKLPFLLPGDDPLTIVSYETEQMIMPRRNLHLLRLAELKHWAAPLARLPNQLTYHVIEAIDPAAALIEFARRNHVRHLITGARASSKARRFIGSVSAKVVAEAPCSVTVVRA